MTDGRSAEETRGERYDGSLYRLVLYEQVVTSRRFDTVGPGGLLAAVVSNILPFPRLGFLLSVLPRTGI